MSFAALAFIFLVAASNTQTCLTSSEEFSTEVVVPDYDFKRAQVLGEKLGDSAVFPSQHNHDSLLVLLTETTVPRGLSVRVQRPTEVREIEKPYLKFVSYSLPGIVRTSQLVPVYHGWNIDCTSKECTFEKDLTTISASRVNPERGVTFEITQDLPLCTSQCTGLCVTFSSESRCFPSTLKTDIESLLRYVNLSTGGLQSALNSYRLVGTEGITLRDLAPKSTNVLNWEEALREELVYLDAQGIIKLSKNDIEDIAALAKEGQAGQNYRIVFDESATKWTYYDKTLDAVLSSDRDCRSYDLPKQNIIVEPTTPIDTFYLIPLALGVIGIILLIVLIVVARVLTAHTNNKPHHKKSRRQSS